MCQLASYQSLHKVAEQVVHSHRSWLYESRASLLSSQTKQQLNPTPASRVDDDNDDDYDDDDDESEQPLLATHLQIASQYLCRLALENPGISISFLCLWP
jgi:hypothetical protein